MALGWSSQVPPDAKVGGYRDVQDGPSSSESGHHEEGSVAV